MFVRLFFFLQAALVSPLFFLSRLSVQMNAVHVP